MLSNCPELSTHREVRELHVGIVMFHDEDEGPVVGPCDGGPSVACDYLDSGGGIPQTNIGDCVLYVSRGDGGDRGILLGVVSSSRRDVDNRPKASVNSSTAANGQSGKTISASRIILDATDEIVLKTKKSCLVMRQNGDIEVRSSRLVARARKLMKFLAPMLRLN
jgi:hypothetical protein